MAPDQPPPSTPEAAGRKSILVVDDDLGHQMACRELLEEAGYSVVEAGDGRKALHWLMEKEQPQPAVMLVDLSMPIMDGWQFLAIMKSYVRLHDIPVILISANEPSLDPVQHGTISAYLGKPYDPDKLLALVRKLAGD